jgi:hypothetical protein
MEIEEVMPIFFATEFYPQQGFNSSSMFVSTKSSAALLSSSREISISRFDSISFPRESFFSGVSATLACS